MSGARMLELLRRRRGFARLFAADVVSMIGDWLTYVAMGTIAIESEGGAWAIAWVHLGHTLPQITAAPLAGWLADRVDRRRMVVVASIARGLVALAMALAALRGSPEWVTALLFVRMAGAPLVSAPLRALIPRVVARGELAEANALSGLSWSIVFTAGVAIGGLVSALLGAEIALAVDALTFFTAAAIVAGTKLPPSADRARSERRSLLLDALAHPARVRAALAKVPAQLATGMAWVVLHGVAGGALSLGLLHAVRGAGSGIVPALLHRRLDAPRMIAWGTALTAVGAAALYWSRAMPIALAACAAWGAGAGSSWVGGTTLFQRTVPDGALGRYAALDAIACSLASALGAILAAILAPLSSSVLIATCATIAALALALARGRALAVIALASIFVAAPARADDVWLAHALEQRAITDHDLVRTELYTWTTRVQAARVRREHRLLFSSAADGAVRAPYQRALDRIAAGDGDDALVARMLTAHPALAARRYAWTTPYGTVVPRGRRSYGPVLIRIRLRNDALFGRFAPEEHPAFRFVDAAGNPVTVRRVLAEPTRVASIYHVRPHEARGAFREIIVHGSVASYELGTASLRARLREDRRVLRRLRRYRRRAHAPPLRSLLPFWGAANGDPIADFAATMPFDTPRHRPSDRSLEAIERAIDRTLARARSRSGAARRGTRRTAGAAISSRSHDSRRNPDDRNREVGEPEDRPRRGEGQAGGRHGDGLLAEQAARADRVSDRRRPR